MVSKGAWRRRQHAVRIFDEVVGAVAASREGKPAGWDMDGLRHDLQVMAEVDALRYCAVEVVHEGEVVEIWLPSMGDGGACTAELAQLPPSTSWDGCEYRFMVYLRKDLASHRHRLIFQWEPRVSRQLRLTPGWVEIVPRGNVPGKVGLTDGRSAVLLPQDAQHLEKDNHVACLVTRDAGTDSLTAFLVSRLAATGRTTVSGWTPRPRTDESPALVVVGGEVVPHLPGAEGCPACRVQARGRLARRVTMMMRSVSAKVTLGVITSLILSALSWLVVILAK